MASVGAMSTARTEARAGRFPLIMGHEAAGVIAAVGSDVFFFEISDRMTLNSKVYCGNCRFCRMDAVNLCDRRQVLGVSCRDRRRNDPFVEYAAVPDQILYRLLKGFPYALAALIKAVSIAHHAAKKIAETQAESIAVVMATGVTGLLALQVFSHFRVRSIARG